MKAKHNHLVLIPGLGADHRLFEPQRQRFPGLFVPTWLATERNESLQAYAGRFARAIADKVCDVLGGVSFGGMIAYEVARLLRPRTLVLIASGVGRQALAQSLQMLAPVAALGLTSQLATIPVLRRFVVSHLGGSTEREQKVFADMMDDADPALLNWAPNAIMRWEPKPLRGVSIKRIHGSDDRVFPPDGNHPPDLLVEGAGHLVNMTHPGPVNDFLAAL
ncbi:MAG: alpha/beta hydrolase [Planctomycetota bacterium]|nr:alpha/beta hydrolase [Planctomycetota bacterium]